MSLRESLAPDERAFPKSGEMKGRVVLVTGGAGGLGAAISRTLAEAGASVIVTDVDSDAAAAQAERLRAAGLAASARGLDVLNDEACGAAIAAVLGEHERLDALINNAGVDVTKPVTELTVGEWDHVLSVNLRGPFVLSKLAFDAMRGTGRGGHIVNIASTAAKRAWANAAAYHASKWGLLGLSHALHVEGRAHRIKVTALIAGGMRTPFLLERFPDIDLDVLQDPEAVAAAVRFVLMQPPGTVIPELLVVPERETSWP